MSEYATTNLGLAAALYASQLMTFTECRRVTEQTAEFVFHSSGQNPDEVVQQFHSGALQTPAIRLLSAQRFLRKKTDEIFGRDKTQRKGMK